MDWKSVGKKIASTGATLLGGAVAGPQGAALGGMVAEALGLKTDDPDAIAQAIDRDPEAAVKLQQIQSQERTRLRELSTNQALAELSADTERQRMVNETMRAEYKADGVFKSGWRPFIGWIFGICIGALIGALIYSILKAPAVVSNPEFTGLLIWLFTAMAAILGINIRERGKDKRAAAGSSEKPLIASVRDALRGGEGTAK